jgi:hypothetical protein
MRWRKLQKEMRKEVKWTILEDVKNRKKQETKLRMKQKRDQEIRKKRYKTRKEDMKW